MTETKEPLKSSTIQNVFLPPTVLHNSLYDNTPDKQSLNFTDRSNQPSCHKAYETQEPFTLRIPAFPEETEAPSAIIQQEGSGLSMMDLDPPELA